jgi:hypothetical protein
MNNQFYKYLLVSSIILTIITPIILTQFSSFIGFDSNSGVIGDTIGGITSPIVNLLAAILVYVSFQEQVKANKELIENQNIEKFNTEYEEIKNEYSKINFEKDDLHASLKEKTFESPIDMYAQDLEIRKEGNISFEYQFKYVLYLIKYFIEEVEQSNLEYKSKFLFIKKLYQFYYSKIGYHIDESISISEDNKYDPPFIRLSVEISELIEEKRIKYKIKDAGSYD